MTEKVTIVYTKTNHHLWSNRDDVIMFMGTIEQAQKYYDDRPEMHYRVGYEEPRIILEMKTYNLPWENI